MTQSILIIGAGNFIGSKVAAALRAGRLAEIVCRDDVPAGLAGIPAERLDGIINCTLGSPAAITAAANALYGGGAGEKLRCRVVHLSSMTVYGAVESRVDEAAPLRPDLGEYGAAQIAAETLAARCPNAVILRPGCEYGPNCPQWSRRIAHLLMAHRLGDLGVAGDGICNLIHIDDLVAALLVALQRSDVAGQAFNLAVPAPPTWNEYLIGFARALGAVPVSRIPARNLKVETKFLAAPYKILEMVLGKAWTRPPLTPSLLHLCAQRIQLDVTKAQRLLDLQTTPLEEGLRSAAVDFGG